MAVLIYEYLRTPPFFILCLLEQFRVLFASNGGQSSKEHNWYSSYHQIVTFCDWEIFENCQLKTILNSKILQIATFFDSMNRNKFYF